MDIEIVNNSKDVSVLYRSSKDNEVKKTYVYPKESFVVYSKPPLNEIVFKRDFIKASHETTRIAFNYNEITLPVSESLDTLVATVTSWNELPFPYSKEEADDKYFKIEDGVLAYTAAEADDKFALKE